MVSFIITNRVVKSPNVYPGLHQESNQRTSEAFKPLEPKSQVIQINLKKDAYYMESIL
jgi:hypothetical protein